MVRNLTWSAGILGITLASALVAQEEAEPAPSPPPAMEPVIPTATVDEQTFGEWQGRVDEIWTRDQESRETLKRLEERLEADRSSSWVTPATLGLLLVTPIALLLLGRWLMQRLESQGDELKRQRLRLEGLEESFREWPNSLPKPTLDVRPLGPSMKNLLVPKIRVKPWHWSVGCSHVSTIGRVNARKRLGASS